MAFHYTLLDHLPSSHFWSFQSLSFGWKTEALVIFAWRDNQSVIFDFREKRRWWWWSREMKSSLCSSRWGGERKRTRKTTFFCFKTLKNLICPIWVCFSLLMFYVALVMFWLMINYIAWLQNPIMGPPWFPRWCLRCHQGRMELKSFWIQRMTSLTMNGNFGLQLLIADGVCVIWLYEFIDLENSN